MEKPSHTLSQLINGSEVYALLEDSKSSASESKNLLFTDPQENIVANTEAEIPAALAKIEQCKSQGYFLCGYLAYEAGYYFIDKKIERRLENHPEQALINLIAFKSMQVLDRATLDKSFVEAELDPSSELCAHGFKLSVAKHKYLDAINKIKNYIIAGDTYQINYTIKYKFNLRGSAQALYKALRETQPVEFGALLNFPSLKVVSLSPELFVTKKENELSSKPMKGTAKRGLNKHEDEFIVDFLKNDPKTLSENVMIVDLIRNDFGRICKSGSVVVKNLFEVQTFKTIHQMISTVKGKLKTDISFEALLHGLFPCGSITGAPKIRTMEIINELETESRGVYTGAIGYIIPNNDFFFNVPIRTIVINPQNKCEMGIGSGIIYESNAEAEFKECILKADFLTSLNHNFYLIETFQYNADKQQFIRLEEHLARFTQSARYFGFKIKQFAIEEGLDNIKSQLISGKYSGNYKVRMTAYQNGTVNFTYEVLPDEKDTSPKLVTISHKKIDSDSIFQYHKTSRRQVYNDEYDRASEAGFYEAIILNERDEVAEACRHNVFINKNNKWYTPKLSSGILNGIQRQIFIQRHNVIETSISIEDLQQSERVILTNSVRGEVPAVIEFNQKT